MYSGNRTNGSQKLAAHKIHSPEESPPCNRLSAADNANRNKSWKRPLETDTPTQESPPCNRLSTADNANRNKSCKRPLETDTPTPTEDSFKVYRTPTAIVTPVILDNQRRASTTVCSSSLNMNRQIKKKKNRRKKKSTFVPRAVAVPSSVKGANQASFKKLQPKNIEKKLKALKVPRKELTSNQNKPSTSTATSRESFETVSTDLDVTLELGASILNSTASSSREIAQFGPDRDSPYSDVEMLDVSAYLPSLEEVIVPAKDPNHLESYYLVVDTNIFIHELNHIDEIKDTPLQGCGPPHIYIPWVVVQELDRLKSSNKAISVAATKAVRYVNKILKSKHPRFFGQTAKQADECKKSYHETNDDKLIDCCQSLRTKIPHDKVILMTNDKNLANKAMIYDIIVHDWTSLLTELKPDIPIQASNSIKKNKLVPKKGDNKSDAASTSQLSQKKLSRKLAKERNAYDIEIDHLMGKAKQLLKDVINPFLVEEMEKVYGDEWKKFQIDRRLLREILAAYITFWPTVFSLVFVNKVKNNFELLHQKVTSPDGFYDTVEDCLIILHAIEDIFGAMLRVRPNLEIPMRDIQMLTETCTRISSKFDSSIHVVESAIKNSEEKSVLDLLNHNWTVINEMCGMIMDFFGISHTFVYTKQATNPPESEYRRVVSDLYPSLLQLEQLMKKMLNHVVASTPNATIFKKLVRALRELLPSLNIKLEMPNLTHFTVRALERFCRNQENRQKIEIGCKQLKIFCEKLDEAIQAMISRKNLPTCTT